MMSSASDNSQPFTRFTQEQWDAICAVRKDWPDGTDLPKARCLIEKAGQEYSETTARREQSARSFEYKWALNGAELKLRRLQRELSDLEELSPSGNDLDGLPDPGLKLLEARLNHLLSQYETWTTPFGGKNNWIRQTLYNRLLSIWRVQLKGRIGSSKNKVQEPIGPLVRFLTLTLKAIMGKDSPGPSGIKSIIDRAKRGQRHRTSKKKRAQTAKARVHQQE
jgi:hypothetical protein